MNCDSRLEKRCAAARPGYFVAYRLWERFRDAPWQRIVRDGLVPVTIGLIMVGQRRRQRKAMTLSECRHRPDIATCAAHEAQAVALALDRLYEVLAPPAEANNTSIDHHMSIAHVADVESRALATVGSAPFESYRAIIRVRYQWLRAPDLNMRSCATPNKCVPDRVK